MSTRYGKLPLDDSPRTRVFRAIDDIVRANPAIQAVCSGKGSIRSWQGDPADKTEFGVTQAPAIRLTPVPLSESPWYPGASKGILVVEYECLTRGLAIDDVDNLAYALVQALMPRDRDEANVLNQKFKDAGAMIGEVTFTQPAFDADPAAGSDGCFRATGRFQLEIRTS